MLGSEALALVAELEAAFAKPLALPTRESYVHELKPHPFGVAETAMHELIRTEERFPTIAITLRYVAAERGARGAVELTPDQRRKAIEALRGDVAHLASRRGESFREVLRGHLAMCRENLDITGDEAWGTRIGWCEELLARESA
jgi:hypothetical protein